MADIHDDAKRLALLLNVDVVNYGLSYAYFGGTNVTDTFSLSHEDIHHFLVAFDRHYKRGYRAGMKAEHEMKARTKRVEAQLKEMWVDDKKAIDQMATSRFAGKYKSIAVKQRGKK
jgi:hypothetical protein